MKKNPSVLIAILTLSAILMGVIFLALPSRSVEAHMINVQPGVSMITSGLPNGGEEYLIIMDKATDKILVYHLAVNGSLELAAAGDFGRLFK